jgi:N-acetylglucosaminyldiphosphoundecaprenol N-acetyl-beta-D-mannosaminyltransferase
LSHSLAVQPTATTGPLDSRTIVDVRVDATSYADAASRIVEWARGGASKYVCVAAVNNVMVAHDDEDFRSAMNGADLVTPDGMPLVWGLRALGVSHATRVYGPDLTPAVLEAAAASGLPVGFFGGSPATLAALMRYAHAEWPELKIAYSYSPPFAPLSETEEAQIVRDVNASGARILLIGLGCPKQELWMAAQRGRINAVMVGVGAAFDFLSGNKKQAPALMQRTGTEWIFRLVSEPRRLWRRYLVHNPRFVALFGAQLIHSKRAKADNTADIV